VAHSRSPPMPNAALAELAWPGGGYQALPGRGAVRRDQRALGGLPFAGVNVTIRTRARRSDADGCERLPRARRRGEHAHVSPDGTIAAEENTDAAGDDRGDRRRARRAPRARAGRGRQRGGGQSGHCARRGRSWPCGRRTPSDGAGAGRRAAGSAVGAPEPSDVPRSMHAGRDARGTDEIVQRGAHTRARRRYPLVVDLAYSRCCDGDGRRRAARGRAHQAPDRRSSPRGR